MHVQAHGLTYNRGHAEHCTCRRTECTPTYAHTRAIVAPLRRPMPSTVHIQVHARCAHDRCTAQMAHAKHCASTRTRTSTRQVHRSARTCRMLYTHHRLGCTGRTPYRTYIHVKCGSTRFSINFDHTPRPAKQYAAAQHRTSSITAMPRPRTGTVHTRTALAYTNKHAHPSMRTLPPQPSRSLGPNGPCW